MDNILPAGYKTDHLSSCSGGFCLAFKDFGRKQWKKTKTNKLWYLTVIRNLLWNKAGVKLSHLIKHVKKLACILSESPDSACSLVKDVIFVGVKLLFSEEGRQYYWCKAVIRNTMVASLLQYRMSAEILISMQHLWKLSKTSKLKSNDQTFIWNHV